MKKTLKVLNCNVANTERCTKYSASIVGNQLGTSTFFALHTLINEGRVVSCYASSC